ncbi:hypothetical protein [Streptomyces sp. NPDC058572]|uniref:hypothetical protein n=1 Tax=Streptomyces sp. NPDC058572 TaxID=3346546 RepID=UPI0036607692
MGSLRNPIGPLPSSIYWRRRAVALSLTALLVVLIVWAFNSGGDTGNTSGKSGDRDPRPAPTITPGPDQSGPAISEQPGGRDESGDSDGSNGDGTGDASSGTDGGTDGGADGTDGGNGTAGAVGGGSGGQQVPAGSSLPDCAPSALKLTLRSVEVSYAPDEKPVFQLVVTNSSATACKADFGPKAAVFKVTGSDDEDVWASGDCPRTAPGRLLRVPAKGTITHTVEWDRKRSEPQCATPSARSAGPGTYLVEVTFPGVKVLPASFRLEKD